MPKNTKLDWMEVDMASLTGKAAKAHKTYQDAYAKCIPLREAFETEFTSAARASGAIGDDEALSFSYRFGKLSVAKVEKESTKVSRQQFSL